MEDEIKVSIRQVDNISKCIVLVFPTSKESFDRYNLLTHYTTTLFKKEDDSYCLVIRLIDRNQIWNIKIPTVSKNISWINDVTINSISTDFEGSGKLSVDNLPLPLNLKSHSNWYFHKL